MDTQRDGQIHLVSIVRSLISVLMISFSTQCIAYPTPFIAWTRVPTSITLPPKDLGTLSPASFSFYLTIPAVPYTQVNNYEYVCNTSGGNTEYSYVEYLTWLQPTPTLIFSQDPTWHPTTFAEYTSVSPLPPSGYTGTDALYKAANGPHPENAVPVCQPNPQWVGPTGHLSPSVGIRAGINGSAFQVGTYEMIITMRLAMHQVYAANTSDISQKTSDNELYTPSTLVEQRVYFNVPAHCNAPVVSEINLAHGSLVPNDAENHLRHAALSLNCTVGTLATLSLSTSTPSDTAYTTGLGINLGHGWDSELTISDGESTGKSLDILFSPGNTTPNLTIGSTLHGTSAKNPGSLQGSAVLTISVQ